MATLTTLEATIGQLYLVVVVTRLVAIQITHESSDQEQA